MVWGIIIGIVIFGFIILVLTGLGILTKSVFEISPAMKTIPVAGIPDIPADPGTKDTTYVAFINARTDLTATQKNDLIVASPLTGGKAAVAGKPASTMDIPTGQYIIDLKDPNLTVAKIALMTFWILIIIAMIAFKFL